MDRLSPTPTAEIIPPGSAGGRAFRTTLYALLAIGLCAGAWVRFDAQLADVAPGLAAPAQHAAQAVGAMRDGSPHPLLEMVVLPKSAEAGAVASLGLPSGQAGQLAAALQKDRLRLVQLPLFDAGAVTADGADAGRSVVVSTAGFSRVVQLGRTPVVVTLPINRAGTIAFRTASATTQPIEIGAITANGPMRLPQIARGDELDIGVVAE